MAAVPPTVGLPSPTTKAILECEQLCLSRKGIRTLVGFEPFVQLRFLYIDHNSITSLTGLEANIRIVSLFAAHNKIATLVGSCVGRFQFLESLDLSFNELSGLDRCLDELHECRFLRRLWLHHCPVAEEADYRLRVIAHLPSLELLDNVLVSPEERAAAGKLASAHAGAHSATVGSPARTAHIATQRLLAGHTLRSTASPHGSPALSASSSMAFGTTDVRARTSTWLPALGVHESPPKYAAVEGWPHTSARTPVGTDLTRTVSAIRAKRRADELEALAQAAGADDALARTSMHAMAGTYESDMCALGALATTLRSSPGRSLVDRAAPSAQAAAADPGPPVVTLRGANMTFRGNASDCDRSTGSRAAPVSPRSPTSLLPAHTPLRATTAPSASRKLTPSSPLSPFATTSGSLRTMTAAARGRGLGSQLKASAVVAEEADSACGLGHWDAYRVKSELVAAAASTSGTLTPEAAAAAIASCMEFGLTPVPPPAFDAIGATTTSPRLPAASTSGINSARAAAVRRYVDHVFDAMVTGKGKAPATVAADDLFHAITTGEYVIAAKAPAAAAAAVVASSPAAAAPAAAGTKSVAVATPVKVAASLAAPAAVSGAVASPPPTSRHEVVRVPILQWRCMTAADAAVYASIHAATAASRWSAAWSDATAADSPLKRPLGSKAPKAADTAIPREQARPIFDAALAATRLASVADVLVSGDAAARTAGLTPPPPVRPKRSEYYQLASYPPAGGVPPPTHPPSWRPSPVKQPARPEVLLIGGKS